MLEPSAIVYFPTFLLTIQELSNNVGLLVNDADLADLNEEIEIKL